MDSIGLWVQGMDRAVHFDLQPCIYIHSILIALVCDVKCWEPGSVARALTLRTSINLHIGSSNCLFSGCSKCEGRFMF